MKRRPMTVLSIRNCRKGSYSWYHEKRHVYQERVHGLLSKYCVVDEWLKLLAVLSVLIQNWFLTSLFVVALFFVNAVIEFDADLYALKMTGDWRAWLRLKELN